MTPTARTRRADDWWDIETAPKDGTPVLLIARKGNPWVDEWSKDFEGWFFCDQWETPIEPTHWMPLPDPPGERERAEE